MSKFDKLKILGTFNDVTYYLGNELELEEVIRVYKSSTLGERRPIDDKPRMLTMLQNSNLVVSAWKDLLLVGISRSISDFGYTTYLSDLAVDVNYQKVGIGKELIRLTREVGGMNAKILLLSAPAAEAYYPHIGFSHRPNAWVLQSEDVLKA